MKTIYSIETSMNTQERIENYIRGELTVGQIDELWIRFLESPEWYEYFMTWLHLIHLAKETAKQSLDQGP